MANKELPNKLKTIFRWVTDTQTKEDEEKARLKKEESERLEEERKRVEDVVPNNKLKDGGAVPFKSKKQQRYMYSKKPKGVNLKEWSEKTDFEELPEKAEDGMNFSKILDALKSSVSPDKSKQQLEDEAKIQQVMQDQESTEEFLENNKRLEGIELKEEQEKKPTEEELAIAEVRDRVENPTEEKGLKFINKRRAMEGMEPLTSPVLAQPQPDIDENGEDYLRRKREILKRMSRGE